MDFDKIKKELEDFKERLENKRKDLKSIFDDIDNSNWDEKINAAGKSDTLLDVIRELDNIIAKV